MSPRVEIGTARACLLVGALQAAACVSSLAPAFDDRFSDESGTRSTAALSRLPDPQPQPPSSPVLVATTHGAKPELIVYDLAQARMRWRVPLRSDSRPELLGDLVLTSAQNRLLGFEATTGVVRFSAPLADCAYLGAAREAERIFLSCGATATAAGVRRGSHVIALDAHTGHVLWQQSASGEIGRPAVSAGLVLVPWQRQNLTLLDARNGHELARLRSRDDVIDWVRADARGAFFGERTLYRLGRRGYAGVQQAAKYLRIRNDQLPGRPSIEQSAFAAQPGSRSARGRIAVYAEPEAVGGDDLRLAYDRYYLAFYRYLFAYDASGTLLWARMLARDVVAGQAVPQGVALAADDGRVLLVSKDGATLRALAIGSELASASLDAAGLASDGAPTQAAPLTLRRALTEIALDTDNRLVPARAYAIAELAKLDEPEVTRDLLDIYAQSTTPPELARRLADALRARRTGLEYLVDALAAHYDFLEQTRPAPLAVIVPALIDAHEKRAVPRLVERMLDHETPLAVLPIVVHAVVELGDDGVLEPLLAFVRLYRADSSFAEQPEALLEAARGVLLHAGEQGPAALASLVQDGRASTVLTAGIAALETASRATGAAPQQAMTATPETPSGLPAKLGQEAVNATFAEHIDELRACIIDELGRNPKLGLLRIAFIAESDGSIHALSFAPGSRELVDCLYPRIAAYRFPRFRGGREVASYLVAVRSSPEPERAESSGEQERWWDWYAARARLDESAVHGEPWWRSRQPLAPLVGASVRTTEGPSHTPDPSAAAKNGTPANAAVPAAVGTAAASGDARVKTEPAASDRATAASPLPGAAAPTPAEPSAAAEDAWWTPAAPSTP